MAARGVGSGIKPRRKRGGGWCRARGVQGVRGTGRGAAGGGSGAVGLTLVSAAGPGGFVDAGAPQQRSTRRLQRVHPAAPAPRPRPLPAPQQTFQRRQR